MKPFAFLKHISVIVTLCLTFATVPNMALAWDEDSEAFERGYEEAREKSGEETDEGRDEFLKTAGIVLGGILVVSVVAALIHRSFNSNASDTEPQVKDIRYDLSQDVSLAFDLDPAHHRSGEQSREQTKIDSLQPTLTLSMRF